MREIKFRAFGTWGDCKEWWFGDLCHYVDGKVEIIVARNDIRTHNYAVDPKSVGQYTGLKDKNGKEIYEGDIIRYERRYARAGVPSRVFKEEVQFIQYDDGEMYSDDYHLGWSTGSRTLPDVARICEVIGNIYENPELLTNE